MTARTDPSAIKARRRRRRRRLLILLLIGLSAVPSVVTSYISINLFGERALLTTDAWAPMPIDVRAEPDLLIQATGMLPGDVRGGTLTVANVGADPLRYALVSVANDPDRKSLRDVLVADVRAEGNGCAAFDGAILYSGPLVGAGFGDPATGPDAGDRLLAGAARERICIRVSLPVSAGNRYQHSLTEATFTIVAEHAAGTP
jgi:hypothetical protein